MNKTLKLFWPFSLKNKYFIYFATVILVIYGVITFVNMPIEAFPRCYQYGNHGHYPMAGTQRGRS